MNKNLVILCVLAFILAAWPGFVYDAPIVQTDGASHYVYAKVLAEEGFNADNPLYNWYGSAERSINEYPPFSPFVLGILLKVFDSVMLLNGLYGALFAIIGVLFFYWFVEELLDSRTALLASGLFLLNVRAYVSLHIGLFANSISYYLTFPALYFALMAFKKGGKYWWYALIATGLISLTYPLHTVFVLLLQLVLWKGIRLSHSLKIEWPKVKASMTNMQWDHIKPILAYAFGTLLILGAVLKVVIFKSGHGRASWIGQWINALLSGNCATYPCVWKYFLLLDGPLIIIAGICGLVYALYKNHWPVFQLGIGALIVVLADWLFIPGDVIMLIYFYRFYVTFYAILAIVAAYWLNIVMKNKQIGHLMKWFVIIMFAIQILKLGLFFGQIGPAMLPEDVGAAQFLAGQSVYYFNNMEEIDTFRSFKWIPVMAETDIMTIEETEIDLDEASKYDYIYIGDGTSQELEYPVVFEKGKTKIYEVKA